MDVQHQYSGTLGKQGNCQIVVSAEYVVDDAHGMRNEMVRRISGRT